jgi:hypothetical protein
MKTSFIPVFAFLLVGCESSRQSAHLTPEQATQEAIRLANNKASTLYNCQPFRDGHPAKFQEGHWIWNQELGVGRNDIQATVELAMDDSTNSVNIQLMNNEYRTPLPQLIERPYRLMP